MNEIPKVLEKSLMFGKNIKDDFESDVPYFLSNRLPNRFIKLENIKEISNRDRLKWGIGGALFSAATSPLIQRIINKKISIPLMLAEIATGFGTGYFTPDISNIIMREKKGDITHEDARKQIKSLEQTAGNAEKRMEEITDLYSGALKKESSFAGGAAGLISKTIQGTTGLLWKGINPRYGLIKGQATPLHRKVLSYGVRGGLTAGGLYGGYKGYQAISGPRLNKNYTTLLRNNVLAGNVKPSELSQEDLISVRKLGLR